MCNYYDNESNSLLYLLLIILGIIIVANIVVIIWQVSLEREYGIRYEEAKNVSNEYREKYYSMKEAMDSYCIKLEGILNDAKKIVKQNYIVIIAEITLSVITLLPITLMYMIFRCNKEIVCLHPNRTTSIILLIEVVIFMLTFLMDVKGSVETIEQYKQIYRLVEEMFKGLDTILDTIDYQINQYI